MVTTKETSKKPKKKKHHKKVKKGKRRKKSKKTELVEIKSSVLYLSYLSSPKGVPHQAPIDRGPRVALSEIIDRLTTLSTPKVLTPKYHEDPNAWKQTTVPRSALNYKLTHRVDLLSQPVRRHSDEFKRIGCVAPTALRAHASERIKQLAVPRQRLSDVSMTKKFNEHPYYISTDALKYNPTQRILRLSQPAR